MAELDMNEMAEDTCDAVIDGKVCGEHIGFGMRLFHLRRCDEHAGVPDAEEQPDEPD